jgi:hypothetical protein
MKVLTVVVYVLQKKPFSVSEIWSLQNIRSLFKYYMALQTHKTIM